MSLRYQHRRNCNLITTHGIVQLDEDGFVLNSDQFDTIKLLEIEGFYDTEIFEGPPRKPKATPETEAAPNETQYWGLIKELLREGAKKNEQGYIQMEDLTAALREREWPLISGTRRNQISDAGKKRDEDTAMPTEE